MVQAISFDMWYRLYCAGEKEGRK